MFANERKRSDRDPDFTGQGLVGGVEHWVSMWVKRSKKTGEEFFSLSLRPKDQQRREQSSSEGYQEDRGGYSRGPSNFSQKKGPAPAYQEDFAPEFGGDWERE